MKKVLSLAVLAALAVSPALAEQSQSRSQQQQGMSDQESRSQQQSGSQGQSANLDQQTVRQVQQALDEQGYDPGTVDGVWGPSTQQALRQFEQDQGLQADGRWDQQTASALGIEQGDSQQAQTPGNNQRQQRQQQQRDQMEREDSQQQQDSQGQDR